MMEAAVEIMAVVSGERALGEEALEDIVLNRLELELLCPERRHWLHFIGSLHWATR
jgi:hypothetical protein